MPDHSNTGLQDEIGKERKFASGLPILILEHIET
jgi:hypothetical protein